MSQIIAFLKEPGFLAFVSLVLVLSYSYFHVAIATKRDSERIAEWLRERHGGLRYELVVGRMLDTVDRWLTPDSTEDAANRFAEGKLDEVYDHGIPPPNVKTRAAAEKVGAAPHGWTLFDFAIGMAVVYPALLLFVTWILTGEAGKIGGFVILPAEPPIWTRIVSFCSLLITAFVLVMRALFFIHDNYFFIILVSSWVLGGLGIFVAVFNGGGVVSAPIAALMAISGVYFFKGVMTFSVVLAGAVLGLFVTTFAHVIEVPNEIAPIVLGGVGAGVGGLIVIVSVSGVSRATQNNMGGMGYTLFACGAFLILFGGAAILPHDGPNITAMILFLGIFTVINAIFDYLSIAATRLLIRIGTHNRRWALFLSIADLAAAAIFFTGLGCALIAVTHTMNTVAGRSVIDLQALFEDLHHPERWTGYWWLYAMIFSTIIPTFLHLAISTFSIVALVPRRPKEWVLAMLPSVETDYLRRIGAASCLSLMATFSFALPVVVTAGMAVMLYRFLPDIGAQYLFVFESFARWIGASVEAVWI